jgi:hypothetical protein
MTTQPDKWCYSLIIHWSWSNPVIAKTEMNGLEEVTDHGLTERRTVWFIMDFISKIQLPQREAVFVWAPDLTTSLHANSFSVILRKWKKRKSFNRWWNDFCHWPESKGIQWDPTFPDPKLGDTWWRMWRELSEWDNGSLIGLWPFHRFSCTVIDHMGRMDLIGPGLQNISQPSYSGHAVCPKWWKLFEKSQIGRAISVFWCEIPCVTEIWIRVCRWKETQKWNNH